MENILIVIILLGMLLLAIRGSVKHFRGESSCCGGGSASGRPAKKRLKGRVLKTYLLTIEGMHCQSCAYNVERAINNLDGAAARVSLKKRQARVRCDRALDPEQIKAAVEARGYRATACKGGNANESE